MFNPISSFLEVANEIADPSYKEAKSQNKYAAHNVGLVSTAILAASIALGALGLGLAAAGGVAAFFGTPIIIVSLPVCFFAYNALRVSENIYDIANNPKQYQRSYGLESAFDRTKLKNKLKEGTFCFGWLINYVIEEMAQDKSKGFILS